MSVYVFRCWFKSRSCANQFIAHTSHAGNIRPRTVRYLLSNMYTYLQAPLQPQRDELARRNAYVITLGNDVLVIPKRPGVCLFANNCDLSANKHTFPSEPVTMLVRTPLY